MASEMVEKARKAVASLDIEPDARWSELTDEEYAMIARAAIEALRVPTEGMVKAGAQRNYMAGQPREGATAIYTAMIDFALEG